MNGRWLPRAQGGGKKHGDFCVCSGARRGVIDNDQVRQAVAVEVCREHCPGVSERVSACPQIFVGLEGAVTVAAKDGDCAKRSGCREDEIKMTVAIKIDRFDRDRPGWCHEGLLRLKCPISFAKQDRYCASCVPAVQQSRVCDNQVQNSVPIEIGDGYRLRTSADSVVGRRLKRAIAVSEKDRDCAVAADDG